MRESQGEVIIVLLGLILGVLATLVARLTL